MIMKYLFVLSMLGAWALAGCAAPAPCNTDYPRYIKTSSGNWSMSDSQRRALDLATDAELIAQGIDPDTLKPYDE